MEFYPVQTFDTYITANIWLGRFLDEGIECYLKDEFTTTLNPILGNIIGGIKLCVREDYLPQAQELLNKIAEEQKQTIVCPKCQSSNVQYVAQAKNPTNWLFAIATWSLASYAIKAKEVYHCYNCNFEFDELRVKDNSIETTK